MDSLTIEDLPLCVQQEHLLLSRELLRRRGEVLRSRAVPLILRLTGALTPDAVEDALHEIVRRHAALRAGFVRSGVLDPAARDAELSSFATNGVFRPGLYMQMVSERATLVMHKTDVSTSSESEKLAEVRRRIESETCGVDPDTPPSIRAHLIKTALEEHILLLSVDHLVGDVWSMRIIQFEFAAIARGLAVGRQTILNDVRLSYPAYAALQSAMINAGAFADSLQYWRQQWSMLSEARIGYNDLPFSLQQPPVPRRVFAAESLRMETVISECVRAFTRSVRVTPYMFCLVALGRLLRSLSGRDRIAIWGHFANRMRPDVQEAVGWFANTHLIGLDMSGEPDVNTLLARARRMVLDAARHQEMPVALVWRALGAYPNHPDAKILLDVETVRQSPDVAAPGELAVQHAEDLTPAFGRFSNLGFYVRDEGSSIVCSVLSRQV